MTLAPTVPSLKRVVLARVTSWAVAVVVLILRATCRFRLHGDPRPALREQGRGYIYAVLHAHQVASIVRAERGTGAMVSRSIDGQIIVPALRWMGCVPIRGSGIRPGKSSKGGLEALQHLENHVRSGRPAYLAVDGPSGPRGRVHKGVATLAARTDTCVVVMMPIARRRWILHRAWDRLQIPKPWTQVDGYFGDPIRRIEGESTEAFRQRIERSLFELERAFDPQEAQYHILAKEPTVGSRAA